MRICVVGENINPPWVEGVRNLAYELARRLVDIGNEVHIVTGGQEKHHQESIDGITFHRVNSVFMNGAEALEKLRRDIDVIHLHDCHTHKAFFMWATRKGFRDLMSVGYLCLPPYISARRWLTQLVRHPIEGLTRISCISHSSVLSRQLSMVDATVVSSKYIARMLDDDDGEEFEIIRPFINVQRFSEGRNRREQARSVLGLRDGQPLLMYVGNHRWVRGEDQFLVAFAKVRKTYPEARAVLVTPLPLTPRIKSLISQLSLSESLIFIPRDMPADIAALYASADVFVFTGVSLDAGFAASVDPPLSMIEALSAGTPVVSYDVGSIGELASKIGGVTVVPPLDNDLLAASIIDLLKTPKRLPSLEELKAGFDSSVQAKRFVEVYKRVLTEVGRRYVGGGSAGE